MRIALFTETFVPKIDGIVTTLCETVRHLGSLGHEVLVFAPDGGSAGGVTDFEGARIIGMKGHSFPLYPELRLSLPRASMRAQTQEFQPDLLHVADPALLGIAALYYSGAQMAGRCACRWWCRTTPICLPIFVTTDSACWSRTSGASCGSATIAPH